MLSHTVARRYAKGLLEAVAVMAPGSESSTREQLRAVSDAVDGHPGLKLLVMNPAVAPRDKRAILGKISETIGAGEVTKRFVDVLADKERLDHLSLIADVFGELVDEHLGIVSATITTSVPLNPGQVAALESSLREATGHEVRITRNTDEGLLGGVVTRVGDVVYDGSLRGHLERIRARLESS